MFIRWQSRKRQRRQCGSPRAPVDDTHWRAILVECVRVDGKPRQRHVAYIVGFTESAAASLPHRRYIWDRADERLDRLHNRLSSQERKRIEKDLTKKLGRQPSKAERARQDHKLAEILNLGRPLSAAKAMSLLQRRGRIAGGPL
jgi:hypothetical protein